MQNAAEIVEIFASSLDAEDYARTASCLSAECLYDSPSGRLNGPLRIIESYQQNGDSARERFDEVSYRHDIETLGEGWFLVLFVDELRAGGRLHVFRCHQRVRVTESRICHIVQEELPGQRDQLNEFLDSLD